MTEKERQEQERARKLKEIRERLKQAEEDEIRRWEEEQAELRKKNIDVIVNFAEEEGLLSLETELLIGFILTFKNAKDKDKEIWTLKGSEAVLVKETEASKNAILTEVDIEIPDIEDNQIVKKDSKDKSAKEVDKDESKKVVGEILSDEKYCPECAKDEKEIELIRRKDFKNSNKEIAYCATCKKMFNIQKISRN